MPSPSRALYAVERQVARVVRGARHQPKVQQEAVGLRSGSGLHIEMHVHHIGSPGRRAAVLLCPGIDEPGTVFDSWRGPLRADEVAALGAVVAHFDPSGRGRSWGDEDHGGLEHQDQVATAVRYLAARADVDPHRIGVVALSQGVSMAVGALARYDLPVRWLVDWEGPSDREILTAGGTRMAPAGGHALSDDGYWTAREAVRHVAQLRCGYVRLQADPDHAQPGETRHALRMLEAAEGGALPWFQVNDHPRGVLPPRPNWMAGGLLSANRALLRKIRTLIDAER